MGSVGGRLGARGALDGAEGGDSAKRVEPIPENHI